MRKPNKKLLSTLLTLVMLVSLLPLGGAAGAEFDPIGGLAALGEFTPPEVITVPMTEETGPDENPAVIPGETPAVIPGENPAESLDDAVVINDPQPASSPAPAEPVQESPEESWDDDWDSGALRIQTGDGTLTLKAEGATAPAGTLRLEAPAAEELYLDRLALEKELGYFTTDWTVLNLVDEEGSRKVLHADGDAVLSFSGPAMEKYKSQKTVFALLSLDWEGGQIVGREVSIAEATANADKTVWTLHAGNLQALVIAVPTALPYVDPAEEMAESEEPEASESEAAELEATESDAELALSAAPKMKLGAPLKAPEDPVTEYHVWVGEKQVDSGNKDDILGDGSAKFDPSTNTLTFTTATPNITGAYNNHLIFASSGNLTIDAPSGLNLTNSSGYGVNVPNGTLTINGNTTIETKDTALNAKSITINGNADITTTDGGIPVNGFDGDVTITGNLTAKADGQYVVLALGNLNIDGSVKAENARADGQGLVAPNGSITIGSDTTIKTQDTALNAKSITINGNADITTTDGGIPVNGFDGDVTITGNLTAKADGQYVVLALGNLNIDGNVEAENKATDGQGLVAPKGKITMTSTTGTWDIKAGNYAIRAEIDFKIPDSHEVTTPADGKIAQVGDYTTVTESDGTTVAAHAVIKPKVTKYPVWVGGVQVTETNKNDILGDGGKAKFDPSTNTLTLNGLTVGDGGHEKGASIYSEGINLTVTGSATLTGGKCGILVDGEEGGGDLTLNNVQITSSGSLQYGVYADGDISINDGKIDVSAGYTGIEAVKSLTISGGTVTAEGKESEGIHAREGISISKADVIATAGFDAIHSLGGDISISESSVTATGEKYDGIFNDGGTVTIYSGTVDASGKNGIGIDAVGRITISDGTVTAIGKTKGISSYGDETSGVTISGGTVTATATDTTDSTGISAKRDIAISGDEVTATAGTGLGTTAIYSESGNITISGGTVKVVAGEGGILAYKGTIDIQNGTARVESDGGTIAVRGQAGITIGDELMIKEPDGGTVEVISSGSANVMDGTNVASHALIVPKEDAVFPVRVNLTTWDKDGHVISEVGGTATADKTEVKKGDTITVTATPNTGFKLVEIMIGNGIEIGDTVESGTPYTVPSDFKPLSEDKAMIVDVTFQQAIYTVKFNANGGSGTMADVTVTAGDKLTLPDCGFTPQEGKEFDKWDAGAPGDEVEVIADSTITAIWKDKAVTYPVVVVVTTQDKDGHVISEVGGTATADKTEAAKGDTITVTVTPNAGFALEFIEFGDGVTGGYQQGTETSSTVPDDFTTASGELQIDVTFKEIPPTTYTVTFETNGGGAVADQTVNAGEQAVKPTDPTRSGFVFDGWYQDSTLTTAFDFETPIKADVTAYAKWTAEEKPGEIVYTVVSGGDSTWTKGSKTDVTITVKRNVDDDTCFSHFASVQLGSETLVNGTDYTAAAGSTVITLKAACLEKQTTGVKTVTINFDDGKAATGLTIKAADSGSDGGKTDKPDKPDKTDTSGGSDGTRAPKTGDEGRHLPLWYALMALSGLGFAWLAVDERRDRAPRYTGKH